MAGIDDDFFTSAVKPRGGKTTGPSPVGDDFFTGAVTKPQAAPAAPVPASSWVDSIPGAGLASALGEGVLQGAVGLAALPGTIEELGQRYGYNKPGKDGRVFPTYPELAHRFDMDGPDSIPQSAGERYAQAIGRGGASALLGGGAAALASGAVGGVGGQVAEDVLPGSPAAAMIGGLAGGIGGAAAVGSLSARTLPALARQFGQGDAPSLQQAGQRMQQAARDWYGPQGGFKTADNAAWAPVHAAIPSSTPVDISGFMDTLNRLRKPAGDLQPVADAALGRNTADLMYSAAQNATTKTQPGAAMSTWDGVKGFRSMLGEAMSNPTLIKDLNDTQKSALYAAITGDMRTAAHGVGPDVGAAFDNANQVSRTLRDKVGSVVGKIISGPTASSADPDPATAALSLLNRGKTSGADLQVLRDHLPEAADELTAAHLAGHDVATNTGPSWLKMSPEAQTALVPSGRMRQQVTEAAKSAQDPSVRDLMHGARDTGISVIANEALATAGGHLLGVPGTDLQHGAMGAILGLGVPMAYKTVKKGVQSTARGPGAAARTLGIGALAGEDDDEARPLTVPVGR